MLLNQFGKLESVEKIARVLSVLGTRADHALRGSLFMPEYVRCAGPCLCQSMY